MIMSRTPLRITFVGGGTDIPAYYRSNGYGCVMSAAINKYIYVAVNKKFDSKIRVSYSVTEIVDKVDEIKHPTVRESLRLLDIDGGIEIVSISDIPSRGTGLGSSSTFLVGLLNALHAYLGEHASPEQLAREAVKIEREILQEAGGKQDQYIAAYGGIQLMEFFSDERVAVKPVIMTEPSRDALEKWLLLLYTGKERSSTEIHKEQSKKVQDNLSSYNQMREMAYESVKRLSESDLVGFGKLLHENWMAKRKLASGITDQLIDRYYQTALEYGAVGGKIIGAGGGGFLLLLAPPETHEEILHNLPELRREEFRFDYYGSRIIFVGD
ncbi:kinase [Thermoplasmatales archaeon AK]|nr:kinase [Thermoplasmatales archaeon AK]